MASAQHLYLSRGAIGAVIRLSDHIKALKICIVSKLVENEAKFRENIVYRE